MIAITYIPNIITGIRILLSILLLFAKPLSAEFFLIYTLCGVSDVLDGYIARKMNNTSSFGATFDSIADFIFTIIILIIVIPIIKLSSWILLWIACIMLIRLLSLLIGFIRYRAPAFLHTYTNKAAGFFLFSFPFLYPFLGTSITASIVCSAASISALEELVINITAKELQKDRKTIL